MAATRRRQRKKHRDKRSQIHEDNYSSDDDSNDDSDDDSDEDSDYDTWEKKTEVPMTVTTTRRKAYDNDIDMKYDQAKRSGCC